MAMCRQRLGNRAGTFRWFEAVLIGGNVFGNLNGIFADRAESPARSLAVYDMNFSPWKNQTFLL